MVVASGHMIDEPARATPRFPARAERPVAVAIAATLDAWEIGPADVVITQGARGADLLVAEAALERGARSEVLLAAPADDIVRSSVALPGTDWEARFRRVLEHSAVDVQPADTPEPFARNNRRALDVATVGGRRPAVLVVTSGDGGGSGGAEDFADLAVARGLEVTIIDPTRAMRHRGRAASEDPTAGPKRVLALDGGGMRGLITLQLLRTMEELLGGGEPGYCLADTFDLVAGTSTGAIIAAAIARGDRIDRIEQMYRDLGPKIFRKRWLPGRVRSLYERGPITDELKAYFGADTTLGDDTFRSLLMVVLHRADTDSLWLLTNVTGALYNEPGPYANTNFPIWQVIRGSTAAPFYFPPEEIQVGPDHRGMFQDGGVTPCNNPAVLAFEVATSGRYGLAWTPSPADLLIVSVGTGLRPAVDARLARRRTGLLLKARLLPAVMMNGSNVENARLCRVLGATRHAPLIDSEFDAPAVRDRLPAHPLFSYVRYNASIAPGDLAALAPPTIDPCRVARLDAARDEDIEHLAHIGRHASPQIRLGHFAGFLP